MPKTKICITDPEKVILHEKGYSASDIREISAGLKKTTYYIIDKEGFPLQITESDAIRRLGREEWLKGVARSTFHNEALRWGLSGERVKIQTRLWAS